MIANVPNVPLGYEPAVIEQNDVRSERLHLVQDVARNHHAFPLVPQPLDDGHQVVSRDRVGSRERLVEEQDARIVHESLCQLRALPHAFRVAADGPPLVLRHADGLDGPLGGIAGRGTAQSGEPSRRVDEIPAGHPFVKGVLFRAQADLPIDR
jgi:hypothetical protein